MRDTFVSYLLTMIMDRTKAKEKVKSIVSTNINAIEKMIMIDDIGLDKEKIRSRLNLFTEPRVIQAISVVAGDEEALQYFIFCVNRLSYQIMRDSPRMKRTKQLFNEVRKSWRIACGYDSLNWENILQLNSSIILQEVPVIKTKGEGMSGFMAKIRGIMGGEERERAERQPEKK